MERLNHSRLIGFSTTVLRFFCLSNFYNFPEGCEKDQPLALQNRKKTPLDALANSQPVSHFCDIRPTSIHNF